MGCKVELQPHLKQAHEQRFAASAAQILGSVRALCPRKPRTATHFAGVAREYILCDQGTCNAQLHA